ncbi:hypothetical protein [Microvirga arabica]|uniref:hypothetical protein n=1 Tax=Microvirga arabica TaxID=1128671 RepID=UPI00193AABD5|nr:hypothetical protein [Microvirga arabica]MBM1172662.1 hypothetical protein [Microvirga arabica]
MTTKSARLHTKQQLFKTFTIKRDMLTWLIDKRVITPEADGCFDVIKAASQVFAFCYEAISVRASADMQVKKSDALTKELSAEAAETKRRLLEILGEIEAVKQQTDQLERDLEGDKALLKQFREIVRLQPKPSRKDLLKLVHSAEGPE